MTDPLCRWCHETLAEHREESAPSARMPCLGKKSGFAAAPAIADVLGAPQLFGKPMAPLQRELRCFETIIGPIRIGVMPAVGFNAGKSYWFVEGAEAYSDIASGYSADHAAAALDAERWLVNIEALIRKARSA